MAAAPSPGRRSASRPFQCLICQSRFTRHENLKRHSTLHSRSQAEAAISCKYCQATFARPDLRSRHMKRKHPEYILKPSGEASYPRTPSESREYPYGYHVRREKDHSLSPATDVETINIQIESDPSMEFDDERIDSALAHPQCLQSPDLPPTLSSNVLADSAAQGTNIHSGSGLFHHENLLESDLSSANTTQILLNRPYESDTYQPAGKLTPSTIQIVRGCELFFDHVSCFLPFLHRATFDPQHAPFSLVLGIVCLGYQYGEDPELESHPGSGANLSEGCYQHALAILYNEEPSGINEASYESQLVQSYLLLQIFAMLYKCGDDSKYGLGIHSKMISLARSVGLMQPLYYESAMTQSLDSLWREFIRVESHKRTLFAIHQIDALWYQFLSIPRSLSHLEIKHDLPCPEDQWNASSSADWAHRRLLSGNSTPPVQYSDSVRRFLSHDDDHNSLPPFDPYGAINIAQFLISSAREISGWSTMTGMLSFERFSALRSSLITLGPFIRPASLCPTPGHTALCEATWEIAMLELHMWSPSHTGGIVAASMDAVLKHSTYLAPSRELLCEPNTAKAVHPHVTWFLQYLDTDSSPEHEAPWVALYAYKAFLIAWQLVCGGIPDAMTIVGVQSGDTTGALRWAKLVFQRRQRWQLSRLILSCLDSLEE